MPKVPRHGLRIEKMKLNHITHMDCLQFLKQLPDNCVDCCVTSPPYFALRDYGVGGQIGLEATPELFVAKLVEVFEEVRRVLKPTGTCWLNLGDSYAAHGKNRTAEQASAKSTINGSLTTQIQSLKQQSKIVGGLKQKDLIGIPWRVAFALQAAGWYLRQDIIWHKPNPMPESVQDRCTKAHEYIFLLSKSGRYFFDAAAIAAPAKAPEDDVRRATKAHEDVKRKVTSLINGIRPRSSGNKERKPGSERGCPENSGSNVCGSVPWTGLMANKRSVWTVTTKPLADAHFATFPTDLIEPCIKAGCPVDGIVLDPFMGAGTTALVAKRLGRNYIGSELNEKYIAIAEKRLRKEFGLFHQNPAA